MTVQHASKAQEFNASTSWSFHHISKASYTHTTAHTAPPKLYASRASSLCLRITVPLTRFPDLSRTPCLPCHYAYSMLIEHHTSRLPYLNAAISASFSKPQYLHVATPQRFQSSFIPPRCHTCNLVPEHQTSILPYRFNYSTHLLRTVRTMRTVAAEQCRLRTSAAKRICSQLVHSVRTCVR